MPGSNLSPTAPEPTDAGQSPSGPADVYPSRSKSEPELLPRVDPIVYGDASDGPLTMDQVAQYERDGFLVLPSFFDSKFVEDCHRELTRLRDSDAICRRPEAVLEPERSELRSLFAVHTPEISPFYSQIASRPELAETAMQLLGGEVTIHQSRVNLKPGFAGKEFYWHSDFETWHMEDGMPRMRAVSCSILLTENTALNGPLMLIPQSHRYYVACMGETPENHYQMSLRRQEYGVPDNESLSYLADQGGIIPATGPAGTVVFFECNTMHGSNGNITPYPRSNLFFVYNSMSNLLQAPFCGQPPRPNFIATREHVRPVVPGEMPTAP